MNLVVTVAVINLLLPSSFTTKITEDVESNKTKRTVANQIQTYGENRAILLYPASSGYYAPVKPVFDSDVSKHIAAQQFLYDFQPTPPNLISNGHANQYHQPLKVEYPSNYQQQSGGNTGPVKFISGSESVANPIEHSLLIRHGPGQSFAHVHVGNPQHLQTHQYIPGKYFHGKILQQPKQVKIPNYLTYQPRIVQPSYNHRFVPPQPQQIQKITKPMATPEVNEDTNEEEANEEDAPVKDHEDIEEEDDKATYEEDDEGDHYFGKYSFDEDEEEDHNKNYKEEEDEDSARGFSKYIPKKQYSKKKTKPYKYSSSYKYGDNYDTSSKYEKPLKKRGGKGPKMHYRAVKYMKEGNRRPTIERFEGRQSQNVPVVQKQKIFKEKWYVTKSTDDSISE